MDVIGGIWHVLNFFAAPAGVSLFATLLAKLLWWRDLQAVAWWRLWTWSAAAASLASLGGLVVTGRDGKMSTYGALVLACALALWWRGFLRGRR